MFINCKCGGGFGFFHPYHLVKSSSHLGLAASDLVELFNIFTLPLIPVGKGRKDFLLVTSFSDQETCGVFRVYTCSGNRTDLLEKHNVRSYFLIISATALYPSSLATSSSFNQTNFQVMTRKICRWLARLPYKPAVMGTGAFILFSCIFLPDVRESLVNSFLREFVVEACSDNSGFVENIKVSEKVTPVSATDQSRRTWWNRILHCFKNTELTKAGGMVKKSGDISVSSQGSFGWRSWFSFYSPGEPRRIPVFPEWPQPRPLSPKQPGICDAPSLRKFRWQDWSMYVPPYEVARKPWPNLNDLLGDIIKESLEKYFSNHWDDWDWPP